MNWLAVACAWIALGYEAFVVSAGRRLRFRAAVAMAGPFGLIVAAVVAVRATPVSPPSPSQPPSASPPPPAPSRPR